MSYIKKLKDLREKLGYSKTEMARSLGISKTYYWQIEHKKRNLSYKMAYRIAEILALKPDDIFYDEFNKSLD